MSVSLSRADALALGTVAPAHGARKASLGSAVLAFGCSITVAALLAGSWAEKGRVADAEMPAVRSPSSEPPKPHWIEINRPLATFDLAGGPYAGLPMHLDAQRWSDGPSRRDVLTYGVPQTGEAFARLLFTRSEHAAAPETTLFVDAARLAGTAGLAILHSELTTALLTRFGPFELAEVTIGNPDRSAPCLAFRHAGDLLAIVGLMCGAGSKPVALKTLACSLDKVDLVAAGDPALTALFDAAERQRGLGCSNPRTTLGQADPLRPISGALRGTLDSTQDRRGQ